MSVRFFSWIRRVPLPHLVRSVFVIASVNLFSALYDLVNLSMGSNRAVDFFERLAERECKLGTFSEIREFRGRQ